MPVSDALLEKRLATCLRVLFGVALLVRLGFVLFAHPPGAFLESDMKSYDKTALDLLAGKASPWHALRPVGYPMFLALVYALSDGSRVLVGVLQALMSAALVPWSAHVARAAGARHVTALCVGMVVATSVPLTFYSGLLLTEVPTTFALIFGLKKALAPAPARGGAWQWIQVGLALGIATALRPNFLLVAPVLVLYLVFRGAWRKGLIAALIVSLAMFVPVGVVSAYNSRMLGRMVGPAANGGINFYLNFAPLRGITYWGEFGGYWISPPLNELRFTETELTDVPLFDDAHWYAAGMSIVRQHPETLVRALGNFREASGLGSQVYWPDWKGFERAFRWYAVAFFVVGLAPGLVFLGVLALRALRRRASAEALLIACTCVAGIVPVYVFLGDPRIRVPFDPLWLVLSGLMFQSAWSAASEFRSRRGARA